MNVFYLVRKNLMLGQTYQTFLSNPSYFLDRANFSMAVFLSERLPREVENCVALTLCLQSGSVVVGIVEGDEKIGYNVNNLYLL